MISVGSSVVTDMIVYVSMILVTCTGGWLLIRSLFGSLVFTGSERQGLQKVGGYPEHPFPVGTAAALGPKSEPRGFV